jgi:hypothetical protein
MSNPRFLKYKKLAHKVNTKPGTRYNPDRPGHEMYSHLVYPETGSEWDNKLWNQIYMGGRAGEDPAFKTRRMKNSIGNEATAGDVDKIVAPFLAAMLRDAFIDPELRKWLKVSHKLHREARLEARERGEDPNSFEDSDWMKKTFSFIPRIRNRLPLMDIASLNYPSNLREVQSGFIPQLMYNLQGGPDQNTLISRTDYTLEEQQLIISLLKQRLYELASDYTQHISEPSERVDSHIEIIDLQEIIDEIEAVIDRRAARSIEIEARYMARMWRDAERGPDGVQQHRQNTRTRIFEGEIDDYDSDTSRSYDSDGETISWGTNSTLPDDIVEKIQAMINEGKISANGITFLRRVVLSTGETLEDLDLVYPERTLLPHEIVIGPPVLPTDPRISTHPREIPTVSAEERQEQYENVNFLLDAVEPPGIDTTVVVPNDNLKRRLPLYTLEQELTRKIARYWDSDSDDEVVLLNVIEPNKHI